MQKISPCLWFDKDCEEAINFYIDVFNNAPNKDVESKVISITRYEKGMEAPGTEEMLGKVITAIFELNGQRFVALDGGPIFKFTEAISLTIDCADQAEVDYFWEKLSAVPESEQCGWLKDKYGLSWQIVPKEMEELMASDDPEKVKSVINALLPMKKIDIEELRNVYDNKSSD